MNIVMNVNSSNFVDQFQKYNRMANFSYDALLLLFDYLEDVAEDLQKPIELNVIALCCDYSESDYLSIAQDYMIDLADAEEDEQMDLVKEYLQDHGAFIGETTDCNFLYSNF